MLQSLLMISPHHPLESALIQERASTWLPLTARRRQTKASGGPKIDPHRLVLPSNRTSHINGDDDDNYTTSRRQLSSNLTHKGRRRRKLRYISSSEGEHTIATTLQATNKRSRSNTARAPHKTRTNEKTVHSSKTCRNASPRSGNDTCSCLLSRVCALSVSSHPSTRHLQEHFETLFSPVRVDRTNLVC